MRDWSFSWAEDWSALRAVARAECGVALVQHTTRRTDKQQMQSRVRKVATLARVLVKKDEPWQLPEMHHQSQSRSRLFKRSRVSTLLIQNPQLPRRPSCRTYSCLKWPSLSLPHSERCHDSVNQDHLACVRNIGYDFGSLAGNSDLFVQVIAHIAAAAVPNPVLQNLQGWTDHTSCQTHRRPQTTPHDVFSPQSWRSNQ